MSIKPMEIVLCSLDSIKCKAAEEFFDSFFSSLGGHSIKSIECQSKVSRLPFSDQEMILGAKNRITDARSQNKLADLYLAIEGGIKRIDNEYLLGSWAILADGKNYLSLACSSFIYIPQYIAEKLTQDSGVSDVIKSYSLSENDFSNYLTNGEFSREDEIREVVRNVFIVRHLRTKLLIKQQNQTNY